MAVVESTALQVFVLGMNNAVVLVELFSLLP